MTALLAPKAGLYKPWYGGAFGPQRLALSGAQKVAKSKRDADGGQQGRRRSIKNHSYCIALKFMIRFNGVAALSIVDPNLSESDSARAIRKWVAKIA
jgi:hypothetical protein